LAVEIDPVLSPYIVIKPYIKKLISEYRPNSQKASFTASVKAIYSASKVNKATVVDNLAFQLTAAPATLIK
jgi:hypothetical protein